MIECRIARYERAIRIQPILSFGVKYTKSVTFVVRSGPKFLPQPLTGISVCTTINGFDFGTFVAFGLND